MAGSIRTKLYPVIRRVSARDAAGKIPGRANKLNTASEMTAGCIIYTRGLFHGADGGFNALQHALSCSIQRNNVIRWLASGINFTITHRHHLPPSQTMLTTTVGTNALRTHAIPLSLPYSRAIVDALRHSSPLHCCCAFPATAAAADATRCISCTLLSHTVKA